MRPFFMMAGGLSFILSLFNPGAVQSEPVLSKSNEAPAVLGAQLGNLFELEREGLRSAGKERLQTLIRPAASLPPGAGASGGFGYDDAWLRSQPKASGDEQFLCLAEALYFEARGESLKGQFAVGEVILNRVDSPKFPDSVCAVVRQGTGRRFQCQFTYNCDGLKEEITEPRAYERVAKVARALLDGAPRRLTDGATYYHTRKVRPHWARKFTRTAELDSHYFYKPPVRLSMR